MGKRIITQRRGRGTSTYKIRKKAFRFKIQYPPRLEGEGEVIKLFNSSAHTAPLAKIKYSPEISKKISGSKTSKKKKVPEKGSFYIPAAKGMFEGQKIKLNGKEIKSGNIISLKNIPIKTNVYCIESRPGDGGKFIKSGGNSAFVDKKSENFVHITFPSKKSKKLNNNCKAIIGVIAGSGRLDKPIIKAGKKYHIKKSKSKVWPRTSAVKMNVIDHPFGSGRAKNVKSKIAKRNAPPGRKVGLLRPKRTGKKK